MYHEVLTNTSDSVETDTSGERSQLRGGLLARGVEEEVDTSGEKSRGNRHVRREVTRKQTRLERGHEEAGVSRKRVRSSGVGRRQVSFLPNTRYLQRAGIRVQGFELQNDRYLRAHQDPRLGVPEGLGVPLRGGSSAGGLPCRTPDKCNAYRSTSLMRNSNPLGPYSRNMPRALSRPFRSFKGGGSAVGRRQVLFLPNTRYLQREKVADTETHIARGSARER